MDAITIPKKFAGRGDLVIILRREYEVLLGLKKIKEFKPTAAQKKALMNAEQNFRGGKTLSYYELAKRLGSAH